MGGGTSVDHQHAIISNNPPNDNNAFSGLYLACCQGNLNDVRALLEMSHFETINRHEANGSTALHAAVEHGHVEIVRLLLYDYGVIRYLKDHNGSTAFQVAQTEELRQLFKRPTSAQNRFRGDDIFQILFTYRQLNNNDNDERPSSDFVEGYNEFQLIQKSEFFTSQM